MKFNFKWGLFYDKNQNFDFLFSEPGKPALLVALYSIKVGSNQKVL